MVFNPVVLPADADPAWQSYTPSITAVTTNPTPHASFVITGRYCFVGKLAIVSITYQQTSAGTAGSGAYLFSLPPAVTPDFTQVVAASGGGPNNEVSTVGRFSAIFNPSISFAGGAAFLWNASNLVVCRDRNGTNPTWEGSGNSVSLGVITQVSILAFIPII